ncbi:MAG: SurA N-terminal domain-containing protein [Tannerella sp.]|jgi:peptidyl-prolyl cis-trans isomerase D|nr:SurA N-terminal domain-containing protein [Tannerella sp.]
MATLEKIRKKAGLLVTVVGVALFAFIIGDLLNSGNSWFRKNQNNVIVVEGKVIDYQDYIRKENELTEISKIQTGTQSLSEEYMAQIRQSVYDEIIMENVFEKRLDRLGITVTPEEMTDMIEGENISPVLVRSPYFKNPETGAFDRNAILTFLNQIKDIENYPEDVQAQLSQYRTLWNFWEKNIKMNRLNEKYMTLLTKAIVPNSLDAKDAFNINSESSDIVYVMEPFGSVPDTALQISKSEIEKLYNERKEMFKQNENAIIDYISLDIVPSQEDFNKASEEMNEIRKELETTDNVAALTNEKSEKKYIDAFFSIASFAGDEEIIDFVTAAEIGAIEGPAFKDNKYRIFKLLDKTVAPDSVNIQIITVAARASQENTKAYTDSLTKVLNDGADFAEIALQYSVDQFAQRGGELGWITEAGALQILNDEFRKTAFSLPVGQCAVVKSNRGYHVVKISERTANVPKYKIANIEYTVTPSSITRNDLYNALNQFIVKNNSIEKLENSAQENGYDLVKDAQIFTTDRQIGVISGARQVVRWVFNSKKNQISDIIECDNKFVVVANKGISPEGYRSLPSVTPQLRTFLMAKKRGEKIAADLKTKNLTSIDAYADAMGVTPDTVRFITMGTSRIASIGFEPKLNAFITYSPLNQVSEPIVGDNGVYVFKVINRTTNPAVFDDKRERNMLQMNSQYRISGMAIRNLQDKAKITDNRVRFF